MHTNLPLNPIIKIALISLFLSPSSLLAQDVVKEGDISWLRIPAREYRTAGLEYQKIGDIDNALAFYQKAVEIDPQYSVVYNDLGVLFDAKGMLDRAEENYLKAIAIQPNFLSPYTNLAILYEAKRNLNKAAFYWKKRAELGHPDDLWTQRAKRRLEDIRFITSDSQIKYAKEQETVKLVKETVVRKEIIEKDNRALAMEVFDKAKEDYRKGKYIYASISILLLKAWMNLLKRAREWRYQDRNHKIVPTLVEIPNVD
jgi:tetratricopeptide (TPR) repeat protein